MKRKLLKVIGISFLIFVVLSWIIPVGTYSNGELTTNGIDPVGLFDLFTMPVQAFASFAIYALMFMAIGGFYGVMEKTGALEKVTDKMTKAFKGKERGFLILTVILFAVLSSLTGLVYPLFVLVPLFATVLFAMDYDKVTVVAATVGSLLVGTIASTFGFNISGYTNYFLYLDSTNEIVAKVILLVILIIALIIVILTSSKRKMKKELKEAKVNKEEKEVQKVEAKKVKEGNSTKASTAKQVKKTTKAASNKNTSKTTKKSSAKTTTKKKTTKSKSSTKAFAVSKPVKKVSDKSKVSAVPLVIIFVLVLIICLVGMYKWLIALNVDVFTNIHQAVMDIKIKDFPIFEHLLSSITELGSWREDTFIALIVMASGIIAWIYKLSFNDFIDSFIGGVKKWLPTACLVVLASVIYVAYLPLTSYAGTGTIVDTISAKILGLTDGFNVITTGFMSLIDSFFYNDYMYLIIVFATTYVSGFDTAILPIAGLLVQSVYGIAMFIFPTSVLLIAGLSLFNVSYKEWMKYIWKFVLIAFLLVLLVCGILTLL